MDRNENTQPDNNLNSNSPLSGGQPPPSPLPADGGGQASAEPATLGDWFRVNGSSLLFGLLVTALLISLNELYLRISYAGALMVIVGLGFIIFIHELGHFLVAKWCDVHVTTFSIGFGPPLPFCSYTWGETTYKLAVFPLGGYVQMVGQVDGDESADASDDDPRSYKNKSVLQRMAIISAGVTMNAIFACIAFTAVFLGPGKPRQAAVVAAVDSGKPAFVEGLRTGAMIVSVNGIRQPYFDDLKFETVAGLDNIQIETLLPGSGNKPVKYDITPHQGSVRVIGIAPTVRLQTGAQENGPGFFCACLLGSAAAKADNSFDFEDVIVGVTNPELPNDPAKMELPNDPRNPGGQYKDFFEFQRRLTLLSGKDVTVRIEARARRGQENPRHPRAADVPQDTRRPHEDGADRGRS